MTLKEFRELTKDIPDDISERIHFAIGIRDEKDIVDNGNGTISFPEFSERYHVDNINMIMEGTMAPKMFFTAIRKK